MRNSILIFFISMFSVYSFCQTVQDDFEGNGTINTWFGDDCNLETVFQNPFKTGINTSDYVLKYDDIGGAYANVRFETSINFDLSENRTFSIKIYISSAEITGNETNQISLKLQDGNLRQPWTTQSEIIKTVVLNQWQTISFDFANDTYINLDSASEIPINRKDFNRVLLQVNGENNTSNVTAYIDDFLYDGVLTDSNNSGNPNPVYNNLVWSDEFDGNGAVDSSKWHHQTQLPNGGSWYNGEIQHYTNRTDNSFKNNGILHVVAKKENYTNQGVTKQYTSARLNSKIAFKYGRVEVRAKLPTGVGTWPAIWTLGKNINEPGGFWSSEFGNVNWPACGEIDIMEHWGTNQNFVQSAMHTPSSFGGTVNHGGQTIVTASSEFHVYTLEWYSDKMVFSVDNVVHYTYKPENLDANTWPFDKEQYILLNVAVQPSISSSYTADAMEIDYVRIYQESNLSLNNKIEEEQIKLFPNPVIDFVTLKVPNNFIGKKATIYSVLGQKIESFIQTDFQITRDLSHYNEGIYILQFESELNVKNYSILKM